jgi:hypothetical protein
MTTTTGTTLFGSRLSPFVEKVVRALHLKGVAFTLVEPRSPGDLQSGPTPQGAALVAWMRRVDEATRG